jgi:hypothetical protein
MSEPDARAVYIFVMCLRWQLFRYNCDVYLKFAGMPSGVIITLILNSIVNSLLMRIAFSRLFGREVMLEKFNDVVMTATVGDDNVSSVSDEFSKFNMVNLQPIYKDMGYVVTPANKSGVITPFLPFESLTFLKRSFVFTEMLGFVAPIVEDSIYKGMMFENRELGISPLERLHAVCEGAQREFFLHGRNKFKLFQKFLTTLYEEHRLGPVHLLDYDALVEEYKDKNFRTFML